MKTRAPSFLSGGVYVRRYCEEDRDRWDAWVANSINGTLMHTRQLLSYHPPERFREHSLLFFDSASRLCAVFPAAEVSEQNGLVLKSHPGTTSGGLVVDGSVSSVRADQLISCLTQYAVANGFRGIWFRHSEKIFHRQWCEELDAALFRADFQILGRELSCVAKLSEIGHSEVPQNFSSAAQRATRKAIKSGITAGTSEDFCSYWRILESNLHDQHGTHPTHTLDEILRLKSLFHDRIQLIAATLDGEMTAGTVLFHMNSVASHTFYMAQDYRHQTTRSLNLVLAVALRETALRGAQWLNYGISSIPGTGGREMNEGLYHFKRNCGGEGVLRDLFTKIF